MLSKLKRFAKRVLAGGKAPEAKTKNWGASQEYEMHHAREFMDTDSFRKLHADVVSGKCRVSNGYKNATLLREFFADSTEDWQKFVEHIRGKSCLDIGPCVMSPLAGWDVAGQRHVVEPLYPQIHEWQIKHLGASVFEGLVCHGQAAEQGIKELYGAIDGAILCRNMLDHTPQWPFVLQQISAYSAVGCRLLLWTDLHHHGTEDIGHYDITSDVDAFKRLVSQFGFRILRDWQDEERADTNWGCFAIRE